MDIGYPDVIPKFPKKDSYTLPEILAFANREFGDDLPPLPLPPWLMLHRVVTITEDCGRFGLGAAVAEYDVTPRDSYFASHFKGNPLMPGVLGVDAVQQLAGFMLVWVGARGDGMAFGVDGVKFRGKVTPDTGTIRIGIEVKQIKLAKISTIRASGWVEAGGKTISTIEEATVGVVARKST